MTVLYAVLDDYKNSKAVIFGKPISKKKATDIKNFFIMVFYDDDNIRSFLEKEISENYWQKEKAKRRGFDETQAIVDIIIKNDLSRFLAEK